MTAGKENAAMTVEQYLAKFIAEQLVHEIQPILTIKEVTTNTELLGAYTEAVVRRLCKRVVHPLRVSTGAMIDYPMPKVLRQMDLLVWAPYPAPAVFEVDDFGLVPRSSAFGAIEIKRSNYSGADDKLETFVWNAGGLIAEPQGDEGRAAVMGVVCVLESAPSERLQYLIDKDKVCAIFDATDGEPGLRYKDVLRLINFLHFVAWRYRRQSLERRYLRTDF